MNKFILIFLYAFGLGHYVYAMEPLDKAVLYTCIVRSGIRLLREKRITEQDAPSSRILLPVVVRESYASLDTESVYLNLMKIFPKNGAVKGWNKATDKTLWLYEPIHDGGVYLVLTTYTDSDLEQFGLP